MLSETISLLQEDDLLLKSARQLFHIHPALYKEYCLKMLEENNKDECIKIAREVIDNIANNIKICAEIADMAIQAGSQDLLFYQTAFLSNPTSYHLLRLFMIECNYDDILKSFLQNDYKKMIENSYDYKNRHQIHTELNSVHISDDQKEIFSLFLSNLKNGIEKNKKDKVYLDWDSNINRTIVPLMLIYLRKDYQYVADKNILKYLEERLEFKSLDNQSFQFYFNKWKNQCVISNESKKEIINWLCMEIDERTESIVGGGQRHSYH